MQKDVDQLTGPELDYCVAKAEGFYGGDLAIRKYRGCSYYDGAGLVAYSPSTKWDLAGEIILREQISTVCEDNAAGRAWRAFIGGTEHSAYGQTPLIAAMRAYVYKKLGPAVDSDAVVFRRPEWEDA